jgi:uncharacterized membrane protein
MRLTNFFLNNFKEWPWTASYVWFWISLIVWMLGVVGTDLYALPVLIGLILLFKEIIINDGPLSFVSTSLNHSLVKILYILLILMVLAKTLLSLYSFSWNIYDVGSYSSVVFNLSQGLNYNSFLQIPATADHFTPSLAIFSPLYWIGATVHWLTFAKALSYLSVPLVVYYWLTDKTESNFRLSLSFLFGLWMLMLYKPAVRSSFFEFSPSSLAPPFIILSFLLMEKKRWFLFVLTMLFLLGLKEHMGVVLIGFGLFGIGQSRYSSGFILAGIGLLVTYLMIFQVMPFFRDYQAFGNTQIEPFKDLHGKAIYLVKLLWPLGFLPLFFWRYGVLAAPAIGVNLLSGRPGMYSSEFHYDDVSSTLLLMSCTLILIERRTILADWLGKRWLKGVFIIWIVGLLTQLPASPARKLRYAVPNSSHLNLLEDIWAFDKNWPNTSLAVQSTIGPHIHRKNITIMTQQHTGECSPPQINGAPAEFILLSPKIDHYTINKFDSCIQSLENNSKYIRLRTFKYLIVYKRSIN